VAKLRVSRSSYYEQPKALRARDEQAVRELQAAHFEHPFYGVRRLAIHLGWSQHKARRIRTLAKVVIPVPSTKHRRKSGVAEISAPPNILQRYAVLRNQTRPQDGMDYAGMVHSGGWVQDFTHLTFGGEEHYLAVVLDLRTRQVVGWRLGLRHSSELTLAAVLDALSKHPAPTILHSDQGSEYLSYKHQELCEHMKIQLSCSKRASPWQNGFMERWFGGFKRELGSLARYRDVSHFHEAVALAIFYYNTKRIHSALGMSPAAYAAGLKQSREVPTTERELVSGKVGA
jgi:transposase InsO family protein